MKKRLVAVLVMAVVMMAGCENSNSVEEPSGADIQVTENILREDLISLNLLKSDYIQESLDSVFRGIENEDADNAVLDQDTNDESILKAVLLGDTQFLYVSDGNTEVMDITDVPSIFDPYDSDMKIWDFSVVDLDGDGEEEVILFVVGVAGDMGGRMIFHQIGDKIYGYKTNYRTLLELKTDGTFNFSDLSGLLEGGIGTISDFSEHGYTIDKITYATGTYEGWDTFVVDHQPATEEEYIDAEAIQNEKPSVTWYDFTDVIIKAVL